MEHGVHEIFTEHRFEIVQEMVAAHDQRNVTAEGMKYPGELHRDVTRTHYGYRARHRFQREETVRGDAQFRTWNVGPDRLATGGDQNMCRIQDFIAGSDLMGAGEAGMIADEGDAVTVQTLGVTVVQAFNICVALPLQGFPVKLGLQGIKAVLFRHFHLFGKVCGVPEDFFGNTTHIHAGAAQGAGGYQGGARSVAGGTVGHGDAAAAPTDNNEIIGLCHGISLLLGVGEGGRPLRDMCFSGEDG